MKVLLKLFALCLSVLVLAVAVAACDGGKVEETSAPCTEHKDTDKNGKCDDCGAEVEEETCEEHIDIDGDNLCEICGDEVAQPVDITVTVKDEDGEPVSGISVELIHEINDSVTGTTDESGIISGKTLPGSYIVSFEGMAEGWYIEGSGSTLDISEENKAFEFKAVDNNPDGSEEKPFFVGDEAVEKIFAAGITYHYSAKGASKFLLIENANVKVTYDGKDYLPENGIIRVQIAATADTNSTTPFSVTNTSSAENTISVMFESLPGSQGNPYTAELDKTISANVPVESTVYYNWTATDSGFLVLVSDDDKNHIMMYNLKSLVVTPYTDGAKSVTLYVTKGDTISVQVASKSAAAETAIDFELSLVSGSAEEPIPLYDTSTFRLPASSASGYYFVYHGEEKTLTLPAYGISVLDNGTEVAEENGNYTIALIEGSKICVTVSSENIAEILFSLS